MEGTLRELQEAMLAHRRALARGAAGPMAVPETEPAPLSLPADARGVVVQRLARDIERVSGIEIGGIIEAKLGRILASVALPELEAWVARLHLLPGDDPEWLSLVESLTVHETFFHRDRSQLHLLRRQLLPELIARARREGDCTLRLWSAGCATGEEAYTLAILALLALRDAGFAADTADGGVACLPPWRLDVVGGDISRVVLVQAQAATYPARELGSFRHLPRELERFFPVVPRAEALAGTRLRRVHPAVRRHVRFAALNLVAEAPPETGFDIVLCRNVLIYLTDAARRRAVAMLTRALRSGGYLMLGPTDGVAEQPGFEPCWSEGAVAYRKRDGDG